MKDVYEKRGRRRASRQSITDEFQAKLEDMDRHWQVEMLKQRKEMQAQIVKLLQGRQPHGAAVDFSPRASLFRDQVSSNHIVQPLTPYEDVQVRM
jgi:hypothetical protein